MAVNEAADRRLAAFLGAPAMLVAAAAGPGGSAVMARVMGVRPVPERRELDIFISASQWSRILETLQPGQLLALTLCRPSTYDTLQLKGPVRSVAAAEAAGRAHAKAYVETIWRHLADLGVSEAQMRPWLRTDELFQVRFAPEAAFEQTPGPHAGEAVGARL